MSEAYSQFMEISRELSDLQSVRSALGWDQETMMPSRGVRFRARQLATLAALYHEKVVDPDYGSLIEELEGCDVSAWDRACLREARRERNKALRLPGSLVRELAETQSFAYEAWVTARQNSDFPSFTPWLEKLLGLKREQARCLQDGNSLYEALLDEFEPGMTTDVLDPLFEELRPQLTRLVSRIADSPAQPDPGALTGSFSVPDQEAFGRRVLTAMGFDWEAGRLDRSPHPFCSGFTPDDVRITTRFSEQDFSIAFFGMVHEAGHGLYEQGLASDRFGTAACAPISLGIHESQSRLWEIFVARSRSFWTRWLPELREVFPESLESTSLSTFLHKINEVKPGLIRVDADEVTYGLHVILRYEIEKSLIGDDLPVRELEQIWNEKMEAYLDLVPDSAATGVLQDVHWSHGLVGYFPTYLLGTLYAAQLYDRARQEISGLEESIASGEMLSLREWLREKVHLPGRTFTAQALIRDITGASLQTNPFLSHLETKYTDLYRL